MANVSRLVIAVTLALAATSAHASDIHRCTAGGRVLYSDEPCGRNAQSVAVADVAPVAESVPAAHASPVVNVSPRPAPGYRFPVTLGMSWRNVHEALGRPYETVARLEGRRVVEYWIYRTPDATTRIVFQDGRVTGIAMR